ncbi:MAG TPA: 50S ribosomal protein L25/general stress protein Ctc [Rhodanobacteraceae bacterium]|nr:50S ribosomal protein L25/general stress protein Ctc [Rhodanobacteraceae bacterium]
MAKIHEIAAQGRTDQGKGASRRLRRAGHVPAIVYGAGEAPQNIQFEHNTLALAARNEWFTSSILDLMVDGKRQKVLLRDVQKHPFKPQLLHLDFLRVNENQAIRVRVPLHFVNQEKSPAGKASGIVVSHALTDVEVSCLPKDLPEFLEVDLVELKLGDIVHMSDIKLPEGVEIPELKFGKEHDHPVVTAQEIREEVEETPEGAEAAPAAAAAAPAEAEKQAGKEEK